MGVKMMVKDAESLDFSEFIQNVDIIGYNVNLKFISLLHIVP